MVRREGLRTRFAELGVDVAVIISDTFGRPWREGQTDVAIGVAGLAPLTSYIGQVDPHGHEFRVQELCVADELAGAAELVKGNTTRVPVAIIRGVRWEPDDQASITTRHPRIVTATCSADASRSPTATCPVEPATKRGAIRLTVSRLNREGVGAADAGDDGLPGEVDLGRRQTRRRQALEPVVDAVTRHGDASVGDLDDDRVGVVGPTPVHGHVAGRLHGAAPQDVVEVATRDRALGDGLRRRRFGRRRRHRRE